jgi:hypothetical protein
MRILTATVKSQPPNIKRNVVNLESSEGVFGRLTAFPGWTKLLRGGKREEAWLPIRLGGKCLPSRTKAATKGRNDTDSDSDPGADGNMKPENSQPSEAPNPAQGRAW